MGKIRILSRLLKGACRGLFIVLVIGIINSFVGVSIIRIGMFPRVQSIIVTSTMTTMTHQYIAKVFADTNQIAKIMDCNKVVDTKEVSDNTAITIQPSPTVSIEKDPSIATLAPISNSIIQKKDTVELINIKGSRYNGYMFIVSNPKRIKLAITKNVGKYGEKLNKLIQSENAIGGINAGGFIDTSGVGNGGTPTGIIIKNGEIIWRDTSEKTYNIIGFNKDGILILGNYSVQQIKEKGLVDAVSFGPYLIVNNKPTKIIGDGGWGINPRSVIGQKADGTILLLEIDGRQASSVGAAIKEIQDIMVEYGAVNAANLDGGSSSTLYYNNKLINKPCSLSGERFLPDAFVISEIKEEGGCIEKN